MDEYLAIIKIFAGNFSPKGYKFCQGQILPISQYTALFSLLGTTYGGDGKVTFGLPDLRGRGPIGTGQGQGTRSVQLGEIGGTESVTILNTQMPAHTHTAQVTVAPPVNGEIGNTDSPEGAYLALAGSNIFNSAAIPGQFAASFPAQATIGAAGGSQPMSVRNPFMGVNYVICVQGLYPSRN